MSTSLRPILTLPAVMGNRIFVPFVLLALLAACLPAEPPATAGAGPRHMISVANPHAARAGRDILRAGGSAVDAAIAAQMVLTLVEPQSSGIGGGAFLMHFDAADGIVTSYDGRETAPRSARPGMFLKDGKPMAFLDAAAGGTSVGVPGVLRMLEAAHRAHGKLAWRQLFTPAIELAEASFAMSPRLARLLAKERRLRQTAAARGYFYTAEGGDRPAGTLLRNPALAKTLRAVAEGGADAFYRGTIARGIVETVRGAANHPGAMSYTDLAAYRALRRPPVCAPYRVWRVCGMGPPSSGGLAVLQTLGLLTRFDLSALAPASAEAVHLVAEAGALAFADRNAYVADPDFVPVPVKGMLDPTYLGERARLIDANRAGPKRAPGRPAGAEARLAPAGSGDKGLSTTHLSIVDDAGNAVSMTSSVETVFGSRLMTGGFILNNQLTDFSFRPQVDGRPVANSAAPGKRPRSSMAPTLVFDGNGRLVMAVGSPGGSRIIGFVTKAVIAALDWRLSMQSAVDLPNFLNRNGATELEQGAFADRLKPALEGLGHKVRTFALESGLHGIRVTPDGLDGGADKRREGAVLAD